MELAKFRCEFDPSHKLFVARATGSRYVEVHHVIPKRFQEQFYLKRHKDLTRLDNLCCLCPWCHRAMALQTTSDALLGREDTLPDLDKAIRLVARNAEAIPDSIKRRLIRLLVEPSSGEEEV